MAKLDFSPLKGEWRNGTDFLDVEVTRITSPGVLALLYTCYVNIDYDGAANAYGPKGKQTLDYLSNAGYPNWWYGVLALHPQGRTQDYNDDSKASFTIGTKGPLITEYFKSKGKELELDKDYPDSVGRLPVKRKDGTYKGYFLSATGKNMGGYLDMYEPSSYVDASTVPFGALSGDLQTKGGVKTNDSGLAIRHNMPLQSAFPFVDPGSTKGEKRHAVGECSYKLFLELGGPEKTPGVTPDNNFSVSFLVFPKSGGSCKNAIRCQLEKMSQAENSPELPMLMAYAGQVGKGKSGMTGLQIYRKELADKKVPTFPKNYVNIALGLAAHGFRGDIASVAGGWLVDQGN